MALLCFNSFKFTIPHSSFPSSSSSIFAVGTAPISRAHVALPRRCLKGVRIWTPFVAKRRSDGMIVGAAAADGDGADGATSAEEEGGGGSQSLPPSESKKEVVQVDKLPLESKLKEREEQRLRMKLAMKIRLKRKRLVRKRKLRKKGRWPPSKMKKLQNV
ncbi:large ribosomal subunit protein cL37 isoform X1 [Gastrolobium bilobum]|uniref:large ribosomal subunit protein cL37 isoform X1 n=1 Tax=Gastrolobium bilobum TaxID=150636 RepID=UPI002AB0872B|nr:large ribosomal subunit protein cL37 isoform X1 [Gastrolobium bilobum]